MIRTYLELDVQPGAADGLAKFFRRQNFLKDSVAQDGCSSAQLTVSDDGEVAVVTAEWADHDAYQSWVANPGRGDDAEELSSFLKAPISAETVGRVFNIVLDGAD